jgi:hypothetical protein
MKVDLDNAGRNINDMEKEEGMEGQKRSFAKLGLVILWLALLMVSLEIRSEDIAYGAQTTGGVNWIDPLNYAKPAFSPITVPDEASCPNKYYVNLSGGSGTTCSQASPCGSLSSVSGKAGTTGGPAYIYVKGTGAISITGTLYGASGTEIVIKPWPGETAKVILNGPNAIESSNARYIIVDGGPNMLFRFKGISGYGEGNSNGYAININSNYITLYRSEFVMNGGTQLIGISRNGGNVTGTSLINCELYDDDTNWAGTLAGHAALMYPGGGNNCSGSSTTNNTTVRNCIFRHAGPEAIEFNPRTLADGVLIEGNAFRDMGKKSCGTTWHCRPAVVIDGPSCGGVTKNVTIRNNLMWDIGSSGIWDRGGASTAYFYNNTIYDYGKSSTDNATPQGISGYNNGGKATVKDNVIYAPGGTAPFDSSAFIKSNNVCSASGCVAYNSGTLLSTDQNNLNFLKIGPSSNATNAGVSLGIATDYRGAPRLNLNGAYDIGAFAYSAEQPAPSPPLVMGIQ